MTLTLYDRQGVATATPMATAATLGVFDGVHLGHRDLLRQLRERNEGMPTVAVALTAHPSYVLGRRGDDLWLDDVEEHREWLFRAGVDLVAELPFTPEVASMSACQMVEELHQKLHMQRLLMGYDSRFGNRENDDFDRLPTFAASLGITVEKGEPLMLKGGAVSSSRIREALLRGDMSEVATLMGRHYHLRGIVGHGRGVGHTLGFPTANVAIEKGRKMWPAEGVYAVSLHIGNNHQDALPGMANLGGAPTFGVAEAKLEVYLFNYSGDLYGQDVQVDFIERVRDIRHFATPHDLQEQIGKDLKRCQAIFNSTL